MCRAVGDRASIRPPVRVEAMLKRPLGNGRPNSGLACWWRRPGPVPRALPPVSEGIGRSACRRLSTEAATLPCAGGAVTVGPRVLLRDLRRIGLPGPIRHRRFRIADAAGSRCPGTAELGGHTRPPSRRTRSKGIGSRMRRYWPKQGCNSVLELPASGRRVVSPGTALRAGRSKQAHRRDRVLEAGDGF
jgi:hypothetical protein